MIRKLLKLQATGLSTFLMMKTCKKKSEFDVVFPVYCGVYINYEYTQFTQFTIFKRI